MSETPKEAARRLLSQKIARGYLPRALHEYTNDDGQPIYWRARLEHPDGDRAPEGRKVIRPFYLNGHGYKLGEPEFPPGKKPIYYLHRIANNEGPVWIVEGEKAADALTKLGAIATTSGGADSATAADWSPLAGRACILWPDNDDAGRAYMGDVAAALGSLGCTLEAVDVDALALPPKCDAADWLADRTNATLGDLEAIPRVTPHPIAPDATAADLTGPTVRLVRGDTVAPERVEWIWPGYLAAGKLHIVAGRPGCGKTTLALALAATITSGGRWPDGTRAEVGNVLIWSGEDDAADTLVPRLMANGADMARVHLIGGVEQAGRSVTFDPADHMGALALAAARVGNVRLVVVDPVVSAVRGDGNSNTEVRRALQPIVDLAAKLHAAAFGVSHFTKGSEGRDVAERVTGSLAFGAAPRVVLAAAKIPATDDDPGGRILVRAKCNIGEDSGGYRYDLDQVEVEGHPGLFASRVLWGAAVDGSARELLREAETSEDGDRDGPKRFLAEYLRGMERPVTQLMADASANGFSRDQMNRAKRALGALAVKRGMKGAWYWHLPEDGGVPTGEHEGSEESGPAGAHPSPLPSLPKMAATEDGGEESGPKNPHSSHSSTDSGRRWRVTRAAGESFHVNTPGLVTVAEMTARYPGATVERCDNQ